MPPKKFYELFEPGIGTGRIAIPLAEKGYHVNGIDISQEMLEYLHNRLDTRNDNLSLFYGLGDITKLPFSDMSFDIAIAAHLFYFIEDWKKAVNEILRTLKTDGKLVLMHTGTGTEIPSLNQRYKELSETKGYKIENIGVKSNQQIVVYLAELGYQIETVNNRWRWTQKINLDQGLEYLKARAYSFTTITPDDVHQSVIETLVSELKRKYGGLQVEIEVPNQIYFVLASPPLKVA